ncbi:hypothetical protein PHLGIDRAFT_309557 [Phlebiopsis gigantea 11061_1 CR5-6]|uniref:Carboxylic ester hydrolase n=1 Tax=Phlebiopsis gigantea (strain 11061_1 CR5-6) TaxID=745531 RepID=A0A0C3RQK4_PHLG1|nr:hypothetical protein PHLGIDRAFT_309557 [Phlebiopsis gigantea 11061_1 CR5-6]
MIYLGFYDVVEVTVYKMVCKVMQDRHQQPYTMWIFTACTIAVLASTLGSVAANGSAEACTSFKLNIPGVSLNGTTHFPANALVALTTFQSSINTTDLPAFCRLQLVLTTNATARSTAQTEVWLPDTWNGRFLALGNGGLSGGVNVADLGNLGVKQGFAGISTDTGHESGSNDGTWGGPHNDNAIIDFGFRAMHMSVVSGKEVVQQYYRQGIKKSYYLGCSTGGRQGLKEVQEFPDDFDGVVVGSPANWMTHLQAWSMHVNLEVLPTTSPRFIPENLWTDVIAAEVLKQCDALDGLSDGIISDPRICSFRPETLTCRPNQNTSTCLTSPQIFALHHIYSDYFEANQTYVFGSYYPGGETGFFGGLTGSNPFPIPAQYFAFFVLNDTSFGTFDYNPEVLRVADEVDPGQFNAITPNISAFAGPSHKGKVIQYVGWADQLISPGNSIHYYETVHRFMTENTEMDIDDFYRLFTVGGMQHWYGGAGATSFGAANDVQPALSDDAQHNVLAAMVRWVEEGVAPDNFTAAHYNGGDASQGVQFTRPICKYPLSSRFVGGDPNSADSFECALLT